VYSFLFSCLSVSVGSSTGKMNELWSKCDGSERVSVNFGAG